MSETAQALIVFRSFFPKKVGLLNYAFTTARAQKHTGPGRSCIFKVATSLLGLKKKETPRTAVDCVWHLKNDFFWFCKLVNWMKSSTLQAAQRSKKWKSAFWLQFPHSFGLLDIQYGFSDTPRHYERNQVQAYCTDIDACYISSKMSLALATNRFFLFWTWIVASRTPIQYLLKSLLIPSLHKFLNCKLHPQILKSFLKSFPWSTRGRVPSNQTEILAFSSMTNIKWE